jgi:hypothetical protein
LRRRSPELQLSIEGVRNLLLLPLPVLGQLVLLDHVRQLLEVRHVLLLLLLPLPLLPLEVLDLMVLLQLKDKSKRLFFQASNQIFRIQPSLSPLNSLKILPQIKVKQHLFE